MPTQHEAYESTKPTGESDNQSYQVVNEMLFETQGPIGAGVHNWRTIEEPCSEFLTDLELISSPAPPQAMADMANFGAAASVSRVLIDGGISEGGTVLDGKSLADTLRERGFERKPISPY
ncbi:hypothetical protein KF728_10895 [Candidatus Obscuribacterales bacterium]|nr:hypothetical protein [Candidatus Obscuribacterales bacterium]MBX3150645.1 hypothetical protein [Candidatus Obscuribacterales bacterium]